MSEHVAERCPKCGETERHYWCRCRTLIKGTVCPMCDRTREEAMERGHAGDPIPLACGTEITPDGRVILEGEVCLRRQLAQAQAEVERLRRERETLVDLLRQVDVVMDGAALSGVGDILAPRYRDDWALVHTRVRERLALLDGEGGGGA